MTTRLAGHLARIAPWLVVLSALALAACGNGNGNGSGY
jgi:predicted small secreted protein